MKSILLVGAGPMATEYAKVLKAMDHQIIAVGRSQTSALKFQQETGLDAKIGGVEVWLEQAVEIPDTAIVCVGEKLLGKVTCQLINKGVKNILVEKPGGFNSDEIRYVARQAKGNNANVYVGYNRRFYASTQKAQQLIQEDGGVRSFVFEFTEWGHVIAGLEKEEGVKEEWFLANSTHVIDLAFFLGGKPSEICCYTAGSLEWHPQASVYVGAGKAENGALFSYSANWEAPGRWGVEILTNKHRLIFKPIEKLQIQKIGSVAIEEVTIDDFFDKQFKPGVYKQVESFLGDKTELPTIEEQVLALEYYDRINGRKTERL